MLNPSFYQTILLLAILGLALSKPQGSSKDATILRYENENIGVDGYKFAFETSDGITREEEGTLQNAGSENESLNAQGSFSYKDEASGKTVSVTFVADENGYRPKVTIS